MLNNTQILRIEETIDNCRQEGIPYAFLLDFVLCFCGPLHRTFVISEHLRECTDKQWARVFDDSHFHAEYLTLQRLFRSLPGCYTHKMDIGKMLVYRLTGFIIGQYQNQEKQIDNAILATVGE